MEHQAHQLLALEEQPQFHRLERLLTRFGWIVLLLFVLAGLLGLLGRGPLSQTVAGEPGDVLRVEHHRVSHYEAEDSITILVGQEAIQGDTLGVDLTGAWLQGTDVSSVSPQPDSQRMIEDGVLYEFAVERPADVAITLNFRPQELGRLPLTVRTGGTTVTLSQVVLP